MHKMHKVALAAILACLPMGALAEEIDEAELFKRIDACAGQLASGDIVSARETAMLIAAQSDVEWTHFLKTKAAQCLSGAFGEKWWFVATNKRFVPDRLVEANRAFAQAENDRQVEIDAMAKKTVAVLSDADGKKKKAAEVLRLAEERKSAAIALEVRAATYVACQQLYARDQVTALTSPVCNPLFTSEGLPDR